LDLEPGVIFCVKDIKAESNLHVDEGYALAPYYMVYVSDDGEVKHHFMQAKRIMDTLKKQGLGHKHPDKGAVESFNQKTSNGKDMSHYRSLLEKAITSINGKAEEKGVESLFSRGGTTLTQDSFSGIEDFEVVSYMVIQ